MNPRYYNDILFLFIHIKYDLYEFIDYHNYINFDID